MVNRRKDRRKARLLKRYTALEKVSKRRPVDCDVFLSIKDALKNNQLDKLADIVSRHAGWEVERADVLWMTNEAINLFQGDPEHVSQLRSIIVSAEEGAAREAVETDEEEAIPNAQRSNE